MEAVATAPTAIKQPLQLNPQRMGLAEERRRDFVVNVEEGTTIDQVLADEYWSLVARDLAVGDRIEARIETFEWIVDFVVTRAERTWVRVFPLHVHRLAKGAEPSTPESLFKIEFKGPQKKFCVIRKSDGQRLQENLPEQGLAEEWLRNYEKASTPR